MAFEPKKVHMRRRKDTKGTIVYDAIPDGTPPAVRTVYIDKWVDPPQEIIMTIEERK